MPKATITLPDGTLVTIEGNPEEINRILRLYSGHEGKKAAEDVPHRRLSTIWWLSPILLGVLVWGWIGLYGKLNSVSKTIDQAATTQVDAAATQRARPGLAPSLLRSTPVPTADCSATKSCAYQDMALCFLQMGTESEWRVANTNSMKESAEKLGVNLIFADGQNKQETQIAAMRTCVQQRVDVIALAPMVEDGWDAVLTEARNAGIPVILVDRRVNADPSLYAAHVGSDMVLEGERAAIEFNKHFPNGGSILEISGTLGSGAAISRGQGFRNQLNANINIIDSQAANFTRAEAFPVMQAFLKEYKVGKDFQGIFVHNDDMGMGAIEALKAAGVKPGDLFIVSIDGTRSGFQAMIDGWFQADVECNPLLGPQVFDLALKLMNGEPVDHEVPTNEKVYYPDNAADLIPFRPY